MDARLDNMDIGLARLAKSVNYIGRYLQTQASKSRINRHDPMGGGGMGGDEMGGGMGGYEEDEDPMAIPGQEEDDSLDLAAGPQLRATGEGSNLSVRKAQVQKAQRVLQMNKAYEAQQLRKAARALQAAGYSIVSKDDAATSFGEKDSDVTGNRPFDTESVGENDTVIQDGPGAGPGPVSKAMRGGVTPTNMESLVQKSVLSTMGAMFEAYGLQQVRPLQLPAVTKATAPAVGAAVMKSTAPAPGATPFETKLDNASGEPDLGELFDKMRKESWGRINDIRVQVGDLSGGIL
jgi:hypothetical protein